MDGSRCRHEVLVVTDTAHTTGTDEVPPLCEGEVEGETDEDGGADEGTMSALHS